MKGAAWCSTYQCVPGFNSAGSDAIRALSLLLVLAFAPRSFYISGSLSSKPNSSKSWDGGKMRKNGGLNE